MSTSTLPINNRAGRSLEDRRAGEGEKDLENIKVLAVDDDPFNQSLIRLLLKSWKISADIADNGRDAISQLLRHQYDLVLMDIEMPGLNGYETTRVIRNEMLLNLPIIAVTSNNTERDRQLARESGMNDFVPKPILHSELLSSISEALGIRVAVTA